MNRIVKTLAALSLFVAVSASMAAQNTLVTRKYDYSDFNGISVSSTFNVNVEKSGRYGVEITVPEEMEKYLDVKVKNGSLCIGFKNLPISLSASGVAKAIHAKVSMPALESVNMSGVSKLSSKDRFDIGNRPFNLSMSGAAELSGINIEAGEARIYLSGTAKAHIEGGFIEAHLNTSGTARTEMAADADILKVSSSGTANNEIIGNYDEVALSLSGVSNVSMAGKTEELTIRVSGTASVDAVNFESETVEANMSGATTVKVAASDLIKATISGASTLWYKNTGHVKLDVKSQSMTAKAKEL